VIGSATSGDSSGSGPIRGSGRPSDTSTESTSCPLVDHSQLTSETPDARPADWALRRRLAGELPRYVGPRLRAGLTDVPSSGMPTRWITVSVRPIPARWFRGR
jgi:hypothetical protein